MARSASAICALQSRGRPLRLGGARSLLQGKLLAQQIEPHGAKQTLSEEAFDCGQQGVLADVAGHAVAGDGLGSNLAVVLPVGAAIVGVALDDRRVGAQRWVPGGAADHAAQQVRMGGPFAAGLYAFRLRCVRSCAAANSSSLMIRSWVSSQTVHSSSLRHGAEPPCSRRVALSRRPHTFLPT